MWLLNIDTRALQYFEGDNIPPYVILSHRWERDEVTFQEIKTGEGKKKHGYRKIDFCCWQARKDYTTDELSHAWVDTCCIDKTSSAELSEAINSMYKWYGNAKVCYAYLSDVTGDIKSDSFRHSLWFTRGWTLQELLAPKTVNFYNGKWKMIGEKLRDADTISNLTNLPFNALRHFNPQTWSVATRMQFAAKRETPREEDRAYSLLGIFEVNIPLIYGEGARAFRRLQEEILRVHDDLTLLAWQPPHDDNWDHGIFAPSLSAFDHGLSLDKRTSPVGDNTRLCPYSQRALDQSRAYATAVQYIFRSSRNVSDIRRKMERDMLDWHGSATSTERKLPKSASSVERGPDGDVAGQLVAL